MISTAIQQLVNYGLDTGLILPDDEIYIRNQLLMTMGLDDFTAPEDPTTNFLATKALSHDVSTCVNF